MKPMFNPPCSRRYRLTKNRLRQLWGMLHPSMIWQSIRHLRCQANGGHRWVVTVWPPTAIIKCARCDKRVHAIYDIKNANLREFFGAINYIQQTRTLIEEFCLDGDELAEKWERM